MGMRHRGWRRWGVGLVLTVLAGCTIGGGDPAVPPSGAAPSQSLGAPAGEGLATWLEPGGRQTQSTAYALDDLAIDGLAAPVEVAAHVVGPSGVPGPAPLILLLHGYQASCADEAGTDTTTQWPCPAGYLPMPHAEGFDYLQQRLASHGFLTVSVAANGVNVLATEMRAGAGDAARASLLARHLSAWASGEVELGPGWPEPDLGSVLLLGHSRGGEGVDRAVVDGAGGPAVTIRGEVLLAPTGFRPADASRVPVVSIVGYCDGDVGPWPAQRYVDRDAPPDVLRTSILVDGANHNFFNTEWVPETASVPGGYDDAFDESGEVGSLCDTSGPGRLSPGEQQAIGMGLVTVAAAGLLLEDPAALAALDGRSELDPQPAGHVWLSAAGRGRGTLQFGDGFTTSGTGAVDAASCWGVSETEDPADCGAFLGEGAAPHWPAVTRGLTAEEVAHVRWDRVGGRAALDLAEPWDLRGADALEMRIAVSPEGSPVRLQAAAVDSSGGTAELGEVELDALPEDETLPARRWGQQVTLGLDEVTGIDLSSVERIELAPSTSGGELWIIDLSARPRWRA